jgi:hypothetical protein
MLRILEPGGYLLWYDARAGNLKTTLGIEAADALKLFPGCHPISLRSLHPPYASRLAKRSIYLCETWDHIPWIKKTHILALLQKMV